MTQRAYLDYASTAPIRPASLLAVNRALTGSIGDPSRSYSEGLEARYSIETARDQVAGFLGARNREVIFTSGATESISTVISAFSKSHQLITAVEHPAVTNSVTAAGPSSIISVNGLGQVDLDELASTITPETALVHVQWGNQETGVAQPIAEIASICKEREVLLHVDAAQAVGHTTIDFRGLGVDFLSLSAHKLGGPPGIGALLVKRGLRIAPLLLGGFQERARRAGFENHPGIAGFGAACEEIDVAADSAVEAALTKKLSTALSTIEGITIFTPLEQALSHIVCIGIEDVEPQAVLLDLDRAGVSAHSGAACASEDLEPSPVLLAMGLDAHHSLRFSVGWASSENDIDRAVTAVDDSLVRLRKLAKP